MENMDKLLYAVQKYKNFHFFSEKVNPYNKKVFFAFEIRLLLLKKNSNELIIHSKNYLPFPFLPAPRIFLLLFPCFFSGAAAVKRREPPVGVLMTSPG